MLYTNEHISTFIVYIMYVNSDPTMTLLVNEDLKLVDNGRFKSDKENLQTEFDILELDADKI